VKILEMCLVAYYFKIRGDVYTKENIAKTIFFSVVIFSLIGLVQFIRGETSHNLFYLLGERSFSIYTPGIAIIRYVGKTFLRVYSTFPHPNAFAGYLGVSLIYLFFNKTLINKRFWLIGFVVISLAFVLTSSTSAFIGLAFGVVALWIYYKHHIDNKVHIFSIVSIFILSFYLAVFSKTLVDYDIGISQSSIERLQLASVSGKIFAHNWFLGSGVNTFIIKEVEFSDLQKNVWLLQPVHNTVLLIMSECGIVGLIILYFVFYKYLNKHQKKGNEWKIMVIVFILITGLFDHYWFTIQQNLLLFSAIYGISFREK
jgi:hypothetical protein